MPTHEGGLFKDKHPAGTPVRFTEGYLDKLSERERKRYVGRKGIIRGYRLQDDQKPRPIVLFPKFGRFKEEVYYEMPWTDIELVDPHQGKQSWTQTLPVLARLALLSPEYLPLM